MFIPFVIPTSVETRKKWLIDAINTPYVGGYLIMGVAFLPPLIAAWIFGGLLASFFGLMKDHYIFIVFLFGVLLFYWDRWLSLRYDAKIKVVYIPIEYFSYVASVIGIFYIYV